MPRLNLTSASSAPAGAHLPVELLRRYVAGELPPAEEHQVESHTLDCAVCADILEGLELQPAPVHDASLAALRQRLHTRVAELAQETAPEPTIIPLWAWRPLAAAAVLLLSLGVVGWLTVSRLNNAPEVASRPARPGLRSAAEAPATVRSADPLAEAAPAVAAVTPSAPASPLRQPVPAVRPRRAIVVADKQVAANLAEDAAGLIAGSAPVPPADAAATPEPAAVAMTMPEEARKESAPVTERGRAKMARVAAAAPASVDFAAPAARTIQGRITDSAGQPLPGASVVVPGTQQGTVTDAAGKFALTVPPATEQLVVSSIGYTSKTQALRPADSTLALALAPDTKQLSEVVVVRREAPPMLPSISATPAGGYGKLRQYLADSLDYPEKALTDRREGTVRVQFVVGVDGKLSDFKVVKSVSPECDEEALRLLREGPAWFPAVQNGRRTARKVVVNVPFKIEQR